MTTSSYADRVNLFHVQQLHPNWTHQQLADALGRSRQWEKPVAQTLARGGGCWQAPPRGVARPLPGA